MGKIENKKKLCLAIVLSLYLIYISLLIIDIVQLNLYRKKLRLFQNPFKKDNFIHSYVNFHIKSFSQNELRALENTQNIILWRITKVSIFILFDLMLYYKKTFLILIKLMQKLNRIYIFGEEATIGLYRLLSIASITHFLFSIYGIFHAHAHPALIVFVFTFLFLCKSFIIPKGTVNLGKVFLINLVIFIQIFMILYSMSKKTMLIDWNKYKNIPPFLTGKAYSEAINFFSKDKIFFIPSEVLKISNDLLFTHVRLVMLGDWSSFSKNELLGFISHEISHGDVFVRYFYLLITLLIKTSIFIIYFYICDLFSQKSIKSIKSHKRGVFLFFFNIYLLFTVIDVVDNIYSHSLEYKADKDAMHLSPGCKLIEGLVKLSRKGNKSFYAPFFHTLMHFSHPSYFSRVEALNRIRSINK